MPPPTAANAVPMPMPTSEECCQNAKVPDFCMGLCNVGKKLVIYKNKGNNIGKKLNACSKYEAIIEKCFQPVVDRVLEWKGKQNWFRVWFLETYNWENDEFNYKSNAYRNILVFLDGMRGNGNQGTGLESRGFFDDLQAKAKRAFNKAKRTAKKFANKAKRTAEQLVGGIFQNIVT